jgi:hypothetical protein
LKDIDRDAYEGLGKPEALKHELHGFWSRRIDDVNRLVYRIKFTAHRSDRAAIGAEYLTFSLPCRPHIARTFRHPVH